ncbi:MAG: type II toxin-antitoxin system RelE/ParE family toxin [Clostridia bacterium]|nr:type II toxin-antitoxin system RelE/ParE family toxin [Clostridia bacterium]
MDYKVVITPDAEEDMDRFIRYLLLEKQNVQAAASVLDDFEATEQMLSHTADKLRLCGHPRLRAHGYRKIRFLSHRYFMMYRIEDGLVIVDRIFHELQDYENKMD